jgi:hypothetical protein
VLDGACIVYGLFVANLFFRRRRATVQAMINLIIVSALTVAIQFLLHDSIAIEPEGADTRPVVRALISAVIWIPYFKMSRRVRNTFTAA